MSILSKIDYKKAKGDKHVRVWFFIWLLFSILTTIAFYFQVSALKDIDVPTHIGAGLVIAAFIFTTVKVKNGREALALAFIPFLVWEFIEIGVAANAHDGGFIFRTFHETPGDKIQDVAMDIAGFLVFVKMTGRRF